jgi:hypothetical protein
MSTIDPASHLFAHIRAQALAWRRKSSGRGAAETAEPERSPTPGGAQDWLAQVAQGVAAIDRDDPQRQRKAFRVYLRAALAREIGIGHVDDQGFPELVERVLETMESDAQLKDAITAAGDMLLRVATD